MLKPSQPLVLTEVDEPPTKECLMPAVEICVSDVESAVSAEKGGAERVELCQCLEVGGVTPSAGAIALSCRSVSIPVHVLIRPRGGDFVCSSLELAVSHHDVETAKALGASGVVLGILCPDGRIDRERTASLIARARPMSVTFHKAFDATPDPFDGLEILISLGVDRVLTSGGAPTARLGVERLAALVEQARGRVAVMAGGSITEDDAPALLASGLREMHVGSAVNTNGKTDKEKVRRLMRRVHGK
jgi:copper homeostasis protein